MQTQGEFLTLMGMARHGAAGFKTDDLRLRRPRHPEIQTTDTRTGVCPALARFGSHDRITQTSRQALELGIDKPGPRTRRRSAALDGGERHGERILMHGRRRFSLKRSASEDIALTLRYSPHFHQGIEE
jgi:hypothetical protein